MIASWLLLVLAIVLVSTESSSKYFFDTHLDLNKDGQVLKEDIISYVCRGKSSCHVSENQTQYAFNRIDMDRSGAITFEEFRRIMDPIEGGPQQVHLALTGDPSEMVVMWVSRDKDTPSTVQYGTQSRTYTSSTTGIIYTYDVGLDGWSGWIHQVTLKNLRSNTRYYYVVGSPEEMSDEFNFRTAPGLSDIHNFNNNVFAVMGDMGTVIPMGWAVTDQIVADNAKNDFSFILHAGDVAYAGTGSEWEFEEIWDTWCDQVQPIAAYVPYMFAVGNHEHYYNYTSFRSRFLMPGEQSGGQQNFWWSMDYGNVHFTFMSTEHDYAPGSVQHNWLVKDFEAANKNRKLRPWLILSGHRPMYNSEIEEWDQHRPGATLQNLIEPLMLKYKVDLYLCGHMHMYERVYPNINGTVVASGNVYQNPTATAHVVQGTGGVFLEISYINPQPMWSAFRTYEWGYGRMTINQTHLLYQFFNEGTYTVTDQFTIIKSN